MLQTTTYQSEETTFDSLKEDDYTFDSTSSTFANSFRQYPDDECYKYFPAQMMDGIIVGEEVKLDQDMDSLTRYEENVQDYPRESINEIFNYIYNENRNDNTNTNASTITHSTTNSIIDNSNGNVLNPSEIYIKKEDDYETFNYTHRPALEELDIELSPKFNNNSQFLVHSQSKLQLQTPVAFKEPTNDDKMEDINEEEEEEEKEEEEGEYQEANNDDDEDYIDYKDKKSVKTRNFSALINYVKGKTSPEELTESSTTLSTIDSLTSPTSNEPSTSVSTCSPTSSPSEPKVKPCKRLPKKDGKTSISVGKRTYRVTDNQLTLLRKILQIDYEPVAVTLPKSKRYVREKCDVNPEHLVRTQQGDMMITEYGIPFDSIKSRESYFILPNPESYTVNGESYLGAEPTETLYDPVFIRRLPNDEDNHGWCEVCGKWLQLRNHAYAHHFKSVHGISQRTKTTVNLPKIVRGLPGNDKKMQGYCDPCQCWIDLHHRRNGQRWQTWYIHQFQVHHKDQMPNEVQRPIPDMRGPVASLFSGYLG